MFEGKKNLEKLYKRISILIYEGSSFKLFEEYILFYFLYM